MAASMMPVGAANYAAPFQSDIWIDVFLWKLEDGGRVTLERNGNEFKYTVRGYGDDITSHLEYEGDPEEFFELMTQSRPLRCGEKINFVTQYDAYDHIRIPSDLDETKTVTRGIWAVTLVSQLIDSEGPYHFSKIVGGHAFILIERINELGIKEKLKAHITTRRRPKDGVPIGYAKPGVYAGDYDASWPKTDTYERPAIKVQKMIEDILEQRKQYQYCLGQKNPPPIRFDAMSPIPDEGIQNCLTWSLAALKIVDVTIPLIKCPLPGSTPWYIPCYHIRSLRAICESLAKDDIDVTPYVPEQVALEIKEQEQTIEKKKRFLRSIIAVIPASIVVPPLQILLPASLTLYPIFCARLGYKINQMEKALAKKKAEHLLNYFKE